MKSTMLMTASDNRITLERRYLTKSQRLELDKDTCIGCGLCATVCPTEAITLNNATIQDGRLIKKMEAVIDSEKCVLCGTCVVFCPSNSLKETTDGAIYIPVVEYNVIPELTKVIKVDSKKCNIVCDLKCEESCPVKAISVETKKDQNSIQIIDIHVNEEACLYCKKCELACPLGLIKVEKPFEGTVDVETERCPKGCMVCIDACPSKALNLNEHEKVEVDENFCIFCSACEEVCPEEAVFVNRESIAHTDIESGTWSEILKKLTSIETLSIDFQEKAELKRITAVKNLLF